MKLHLPVNLRKSVLRVLSAVACLTLGSGAAWADAQNLTFSGEELTWDTKADNTVFADEDGTSSAFSPGDNVSFTSQSTVTLGENITAGEVSIESGADVSIVPGAYAWEADSIVLAGNMDAGSTLTIGDGTTLKTADGASLESGLQLGSGGALNLGASANLNGNILALHGDTAFSLSSSGDGRVYNLFSNVSGLTDANGNSLSLSSDNNAISNYFDTSQPGSGFWANSTLQLTSSGTLQLVRYSDISIPSGYTEVQADDISDITPYSSSGTDVAFRLTSDLTVDALSASLMTSSADSWLFTSDSVDNLASLTFSNATNLLFVVASGEKLEFSKLESVLFDSNEFNGYGGAINGGSSNSTITLSNNGSVSFIGNTASSRGGAIYGSGTLNHNGSVSFIGNTVSSSGGAIYGGGTLSNNGSVTFSANTASYSGGAIYGGAALSNNGSVTFSANTSIGSDAYGGAIYVATNRRITLSNNGSVTFSANMASASGSSTEAFGGAIYGDSSSLITLSNNGSVTFSANTVNTSGYSSDAYGGAIYDHSRYGSTSLSNNGSVTFIGNTASTSGDSSDAYGGAIYGYSNSTITLSNNGSVTFIGNTASASEDARGGAIDGGTITLSNNGSVSFIGNTASGSDAYGGATFSNINSSSITLSNNGSVEFNGNTASGRYGYAEGGAIYRKDSITLSNNGVVEFNGNTASGRSGYGGAIYVGSYTGSSTITLSNNGSVEFNGNTASASGNDSYAQGGAIYGYNNSRITLSNNDSLVFSGNTVSGSSAYGGAIRANGNLCIQNNGNVLFEKNAEVANGNYALRSIYANGSEAVILLSAAEGKKIEFRDSIYIDSGATFNLNADYTDVNDKIIKQAGDIIFTGASTEADLLAVKGSAGTETEVANSRTSIVNTVTNLYGGRLRVEDGAVYMGDGITAMEGSDSTVRVVDATLDHFGHNLTFHSGTSLELVGDYELLAANLYINKGSHWVIDASENVGFAMLSESLVLNGTMEIILNGDNIPGENALLLCVGSSIENWSQYNITVSGVEGYDASDLTWVDNHLVFNYNEETYKQYFNGSASITSHAVGAFFLHHYENISFENISYSDSGGALEGDTITLSNNDLVTFSSNSASYGGAIYGGNYSFITLSNNKLVTSSGNTANRDGGAIYGSDDSTITLVNNGGLEFCGNTASGHGGAICGGDDSTVTLSNNDSVTFSGNTACGFSAYGGAIYGGVYSTITLSNNDIVEFSGNTAFYGGAIYGYGCNTTLSNNGSVEFSGNTSSSRGGAIYGYGCNPTLSNNGSVVFIGNTARSSSNVHPSDVYGGAIYGNSTLSYNDIVEFSGNTATSPSADAYGGAIYGFTITLRNNDIVEFIGNKASTKGNDFYAYGGAICGGDDSTIALSNNGSVSFSGNTAISESFYAYGGAIYSSDNLFIQNNDDVIFEKNAEVSNGRYRLRSIYADGSGAVISLSAAQGKKIEFRDSIYIASGSTINLNADYTDAEGNIIKQTGDIIFTGATTESDLKAVKGSAGTEEEILNSRTSIVNTMTNLYGGRLRVEDGAVYQGWGITAVAESGAMVRVKDATLHQDWYDMTFKTGTSLELEGNNLLVADSLNIDAGGRLFIDAGGNEWVVSLCGNLVLDGSMEIALSNYMASNENTRLMYVSGSVSGWDWDNISISGVENVDISSLTLVDNVLILNYNKLTYNRYFNGSSTINTHTNAFAFYHHYENITFEDISYSGNGGAIYGGSYSTITLSNNGSVDFIGNTSRYRGGAISGGGYSTITLSNNGSVLFSGNTASSGGAIDGYNNNSRITLSNNDSVEFSRNTANSGGAIYGYSNSTITLSNNGSVSFSGNTASSSSSARGGAIYGYNNSIITLSNNGSVSFDENTVSGSSANGGAIYAYDSRITLSNNGSVSFSGNTANGASSAKGGAIEAYADSITLSNNVSVTFSENTANGSTSAKGGAIAANAITLSDNGGVSFIGNTSSSSGSSSTAYGGAIDGDYTITLSNNGSVEFSGNTVRSDSAYGGAIRTLGNLSIQNNGDVLFEKNAEVENGNYRLRSIYAGGSGDVISLSGAEGKKVEFRDSIYIASGSTFNLNANYKNIKQTGDIIFTGATTEADLLAVKGSAGTEDEILNSRTSIVDTMTNLHAGRLRVEDGAVYQGNGLTVMADSGASVVLKDATLNHAGYGLTFQAGTALELQQDNIIIGNLKMLAGSKLTIDMRNAATGNEHQGNIAIDSAAQICTYLDIKDWTGEEGAIKSITLLRTDADIEDASLSNVTIVTNLSGKWGYSDVLYWNDGKLEARYKNGADEVLWTNESGDYRWNHSSLNWREGDYRFADVSGSNVTLGSSGAGAITVEGEISIQSMTVTGESAYELVFADGAALSIWGALEVGAGSSLIMSKSQSLLTLINNGAFVAQGDLVVQKSVSGNGHLIVNGDLSAESARAGSLCADSLRLTDSSVDNVICGEVVVNNTIEVAGGFDVDGPLSAGSLKVGSLSAYALTLTDEVASNVIHGDAEIVSMVETGAALVVEGALTAASVLAGDVNAATLSLSNGAAKNEISGDVVILNDADVAGSMVVGGAMSAGSLNAKSLEASSLSLSESTASNIIEGAVIISHDVDVAGSLKVGENLSASSLQSGDLQADALVLSNAESNNVISGDAVITNAADIAGGLSVSGAVTAASLQAGNLTAGSLKLKSATANNVIGGAVTISSEADVAGSLDVVGALSAGSLKAGSLLADSLKLSNQSAHNAINGRASITNAAEVAGSLSVNGELRASSLHSGDLTVGSLLLTGSGVNNVISGDATITNVANVKGELLVDGSLSTGSLQAGSLSADSLSLTDTTSTLYLSNAQATSVIRSGFRHKGDVDVAGALNVIGDVYAGGIEVGRQFVVSGNLSADSLQSGELSASSLTLSDSTADNIITGSASISGWVNVAGSLSVAGNLSAASLQADSLEAMAVTLTGENTANLVNGDMTVDSVSVASGATLTVGGVFTADEVSFSGELNVLNVGAMGADSMNFVLDREAMESLGINYRESGVIAQATEAMGSGFEVTLNGGTAPVQAAAYDYTISVNGGAVLLKADYAHDGMQVWYRGAWVGDSSWTDYYIAGYDAVDGVETIDLAGCTVEGANMYIAYDDGVNASVVKNGSLVFEYMDMGGGQFELGEGATVTADELYGKGETLVMYEGSTLKATELTLGTLDLQAGTVEVTKATIDKMTGTEGTLNVADAGRVTVKSDVTLTGMENLGTLSLGKNKLTVNALVDVGGNVTAGEVSVQSRGSRMASFDTLVADKVTVVNSISTGRYTDDLSVGDGSAIGELVAETLEVREGTVTLGLSGQATEQSLMVLDLQEDSTLVLNQQTALSVTDELIATENAEVQLKKGAGFSYADYAFSNVNSDTATTLNAYALANGDTTMKVENMHVAIHAEQDTTVEYQLVNSSVENAGSGTLRVTHAENTITDILATGGDVEIYNAGTSMNLQELHIAAGLTVSAMAGDVGSAITPANEADITVWDRAVFGSGATLNANLKLAAGSELSMDGPLHMGSSLTLQGGADAITLGGKVYEAVAALSAGQSYALFTGVDSLVLELDNTSVTYLPGELTAENMVLAGTYFSNLVGLPQEDILVLVFTEVDDNGGMLSIYAVPEPSTATLSLLALAALAARRRRR